MGAWWHTRGRVYVCRRPIYRSTARLFPADIVARGRPDRPSRPWLGVYASEVERKVVLMAITDRSPAKRSQLRAGDVVLAVSGAPVVDLASFYKGLWALGEAGVEAPITLQRDGRRLDITVKTGDRNRLAAAPRLH